MHTSRRRLVTVTTTVMAMIVALSALTVPHGARAALIASDAARVALSTDAVSVDTASSDGRYGPRRAHRYTLISPSKTSVQPVGTARRRPPLVLFVHGGGWTMGDRADATDAAPVRALLADGWAVATISYRLAPTSEHPAQIRDVRRAVRHFRRHDDELGVDGSRMLLVGFSAGGHLALLAGATTPGIDGVIAIAPVTDVDAFATRLPMAVAMLLGCPFDAPLCDDTARRELDPIAALDRDDPPVLVIAGALDDLTTIDEQIDPYVTAARTRLPADHVWVDVVDSAGHMDILDHAGRTLEFADEVSARHRNDRTQSIM